MKCRDCRYLQRLYDGLNEEFNVFHCYRLPPVYRTGYQEPVRPEIADPDNEFCGEYEHSAKKISKLREEFRKEL